MGEVGNKAPASDLDAAFYGAAADLATIKGWLHGLATCPDLSDIVADGGISTGDCYQQEAREFAGRLGRVLSVLSALSSQSQAAEGMAKALEPLAREANAWVGYSDAYGLSMVDVGGDVSPYEMTLGQIRAACTALSHYRTLGGA